jgi:hypothetical protein
LRQSDPRKAALPKPYPNSTRPGRDPRHCLIFRPGRVGIADILGQVCGYSTQDGLQMTLFCASDAHLPGCKLRFGSRKRHFRRILS